MRVCIVKNAEAENISDVYRIVSSLTEDGHECIVLSRSRKNNTNRIQEKIIYFDNKPIKFYEFNIKSDIGGGLKNIFNLNKYISTIRRWLEKNCDLYDVVHAFDLDCGLASFIARRKTYKPYVYHISDFYVDSRSGIPKFLVNPIKNLEFKIINNSETTIICTEQRKEQIRNSNPKKLVVVHNTPAIDTKAIIIENGNKPLKLTYVGGLTDNRFIEEMVDIVKRDDNLHLTLAGTGPIKDYVQKASVKYKNIDYLGQVTYEDAIDIYKDCDIIFAIYNPVIKNHRYSAPNKFYEAMMLGKALLVAKDTGVDKLVESEGMGLVVDYNKKSVEENLNLLITNRQYLNDLKVKSKESYHKYSYNEMSKRIQNIYRNIIIN